MKPGERQAIPTSWMPKLSRADMGTAEAGLLAFDNVFFDRSNRRGRGFMFESVGDPGSFLTMILGRAASTRALRRGQDQVSLKRFEQCPKFSWTLVISGHEFSTYDPGDDFPVAEYPLPLGLLPSPILSDVVLAQFEPGDAAATDVLWGVWTPAPELFVLPPATSEESILVVGNEDLSWGAGEGTMAIAALMMRELAST